MKHKAAFQAVQMTETRSARTNHPFSSKVASDTVSRCKTVVRLMSVELSGKTLGADAACTKLCNQIKAGRITSTQARPYAATVE